MAQHRRSFLKRLGSMTAGIIAAPVLTGFFSNDLKAAVAEIKHLSPEEAALNEDFWFYIKQAYSASSDVINLNNGGVSPHPDEVQEAFFQYNRWSNEAPAYIMWHVLGRNREMVRTKLGDLAGCSPEELAICRNATEALNSVIFGLDLEPGDEVLTSHQDYPNMLNALKQRELRHGIKVNKVSIPVPSDDHREIVEIYRKAITPKTKLILVCHMINLTGQIMPIREICDMAHAKGVEVMVDGAHSFAHLDFKIPDLGCDYFGTSLHKWLSAPFGTGLMYVKQDKIEKLWPIFGAPDTEEPTNIRKFEHQGTRSFPTELAIGKAIDFQLGIGNKRKEERLRFLKNYWVDQMRNIKGFKLNTSLNPNMSCGIANFKIEGVDEKDIFDHLTKKKYIYITRINHDEVKGIRVSPHVYTSLKDLDYFVKTVKEFVG